MKLDIAYPVSRPAQQSFPSSASSLGAMPITRGLEHAIPHHYQYMPHMKDGAGPEDSASDFMGVPLAMEQPPVSRIHIFANRPQFQSDSSANLPFEVTQGYHGTLEQQRPPQALVPIIDQQTWHTQNHALTNPQNIILNNSHVQSTYNALSSQTTNELLGNVVAASKDQASGDYNDYAYYSQASMCLNDPYDAMTSLIGNQTHQTPSTIPGSLSMFVSQHQHQHDEPHSYISTQMLQQQHSDHFERQQRQLQEHQLQIQYNERQPRQDIRSSASNLPSRGVEAELQSGLSSHPGVKTMPLYQNDKRAATQRNIKTNNRKRAKSFPEKLMNAMMAHGHDDTVGWLPDGKSFVIVSPEKFVNEVLNKVFKEAKYASFIRKLHRWGFVRLTSGTGTDCFHHPLFQKNRRDLSAKITCASLKDAIRSTQASTIASDFPKHAKEKPPSLAGVERYIKAKSTSDEFDSSEKQLSASHDVGSNKEDHKSPRDSNS